MVGEEITLSPPVTGTVGKRSGIQKHICSKISGLQIKLKTHVKRPTLAHTCFFFFFSLFPVPKKDHIVLIRPREANKRHVFPRGLDLGTATVGYRVF